MARYQKRILHDYVDARVNGPSVGYDIRPVAQGTDTSVAVDLSEFYVLIQPRAGLYKGHQYVLKMTMSHTYENRHTHEKTPFTFPMQPPRVEFVGKCMHANVDPNGGLICLDILKNLDVWRQQTSIDSIIQSILLLLDTPGTDSGWNAEANQQWISLDREARILGLGQNVDDYAETRTRVFAPFVERATKVMQGNSLKKFRTYFPALADSDAIREAQRAEQAEFDAMAALILEKKNKNSTTSSTASATSPSIESTAPLDFASLYPNGMSTEVPSESLPAPSHRDGTQKTARWERHRK